MNRMLGFFLIAIFSIFLGSQLTEGWLLVPYWKTLSRTEFYEYYAQFGPAIGRFYTVLTVFAAVIPMVLSIYCFFKKSRAVRYSLIASFFMGLVIFLFYFYFKEANQQFYDAALTPDQLKSELDRWSYWHWGRVLLEMLALLFLHLTFTILADKRIQ